ncbi:HypC/HybG/HupF family hydrogenase formation chaperone [Celerinatantimonas sp. YJH-8]|uniref:HypC/HybG/HupF family hydrogenase formation chaperone n=1 Tax=Celerinatantimonas sp. YJH-8 TaxID=3228714 RepID=UPI0038CAB016
MCIGTPAQIIAIDDPSNQLAKAQIGGVTREIDLSLVGALDEQGQPRIGQWVLVHVGFAMSLIDADEAARTLQALTEMGEVEPDVVAFLQAGGGSREVC